MCTYVTYGKGFSSVHCFCRYGAIPRVGQGDDSAVMGGDKIGAGFTVK